MTELKGRRDILSQRVPFFLGKYAEQRIAPSHVANAFLRAGYGTSKDAHKIIDICVKEGPVEAGGGLSDSFRTDAAKAERFREMCNTVFNPDSRVFSLDFASMFPISLGTVTKDPSDDGFGGDLWRLVSEVNPESLAKVSDGLATTPIESSDLLGHLVAAIAGGHRTVGQHSGASKETFAWLTGHGNLASQFAVRLADSTVSPFSQQRAIRSWRSSQFVRAAFFASYLATIRSASLLARSPKSWSELPPMIVFGGTPPGNPRDVATRLSMLSFGSICREIREATRLLVEASLREVKIPRSAPQSQKALLKAASAFPETSKHKAIAKYLAALISEETSNAAVARRIADEVYPEAFLEKTLRAMGHKLGLAGPERGPGARQPRFCLETPALALLVSSTVEPGTGCVLAEWIDRIYDRYGLVLGIGTESFSEIARSRIMPPATLRAALEANTALLEARLVRAGLAVDVSDGETEVINDAS